MEGLQIATNVSIIATAVIGIITLILRIKKELSNSKPKVFRHELEYINDFGDFIANYGYGPMEILSIEYYYNGVLDSHDSLIDLYCSKLNLNAKLHCETFLRKKDLIHRTVMPQGELRLVEINPLNHQNAGFTNLLQKLEDIRKQIKIKITYKSIYGIKKTAWL